MSKEERQKPEPDELRDEESADAVADNSASDTHDPITPPDDAAPEMAEEAAEPEDPVAALQTDRDDLFEKLQRVSADYQNYIKRSRQQTTDAIKLAEGDLIKSLLPVLDHFDRALDAEPADSDNDGLAEGVRMVRDELLRVLQQAGVERIAPAVGEPFDPYRHEAMLQQEVEGVEPNHVTALLQPGYVYQVRTLRAAKVAVVPAEST